MTKLGATKSTVPKDWHFPGPGTTFRDDAGTSKVIQGDAVIVYLTSNNLIGLTNSAIFYHKDKRVMHGPIDKMYIENKREGRYRNKHN